MRLGLSDPVTGSSTRTFLPSWGVDVDGALEVEDADAETGGFDLGTDSVDGDCLFGGAFSPVDVAPIDDAPVDGTPAGDAAFDDPEDVDPTEDAPFDDGDTSIFAYERLAGALVDDAPEGDAPAGDAPAGDARFNGGDADDEDAAGDGPFDVPFSEELAEATLVVGGVGTDARVGARRGEGVDEVDGAARVLVAAKGSSKECPRDAVTCEVPAAVLDVLHLPSDAPRTPSRRRTAQGRSPPSRPSPLWGSSAPARRDDASVGSS